ncbi:MAG: hypothetical protein JST11_22055 [Acidobacteria bacterium]|nr:hypothetical protein [Acidobacteriota bacterium]
MSVRPESLPDAACLATSEGALISISIAVDAQHLEALLEVLAELEFPVNPQIYHDAAVVTCYPDGQEERQSTTLVEFPAYSGRAVEVRGALERRGFSPDCMEVVGMLEDIQAVGHSRPAPEGSGYAARYRVKMAHAGRTVYQP